MVLTDSEGNFIEIDSKTKISNAATKKIIFSLYSAGYYIVEEARAENTNQLF